MMRYLSSILVVLIFFFVFFGFNGNDVLGKNNDISETEAIKIANKEAKSLGYDIENMKTIVSQHDTPWNQYISKDSGDQYSRAIKSNLTGRKYWAVYYFFNDPDYLGGDICIFIDTQTGEIIEEHRGK